MTKIDELKRLRNELLRVKEQLHERTQAFLASEHRFQSFMNNSPSIFFIKDENGKRLYANPLFEKYFGVSPDDYLGKSNEEIFPKEAAKQVGKNDQWVMSENKPLQTIESIPIKDGTLRHFLVIKFPMQAPSGQRELAGQAIDISREVLLEEELRQSHKMEAIGRLAGGIAHDFNNLLTAMSGYSQFLINRLPDDASFRADMEEISKAAERATVLTRQLLAFGRKQILNPQVFDPNKPILDFVRMIDRMLGDDIEVIAKLDPSIGPVCVDKQQLEQILMNLAVNARDAMPAGGQLIIETTECDGPASNSSETSPPPTGRFVRISVSDTGVGMDEETRRRAFEPFFTTKEPGKGTGLGLAMIYGIVNQSSGHIDVESTPGKGSTFRIYLPVAVEGPIVDEGVSAPVSINSSMPTTVLLVEDEEVVRSLVKKILEAHKFRVFASPNPTEAIALFENKRDEIQLLLTDLLMPKMNGEQLTNHLIAKKPDLRVLYMSGYPQGLPSFKNGLNRPFLAKPFTAAALIEKVHEVLNESKPASAS